MHDHEPDEPRQAGEQRNQAHHQRDQHEEREHEQP
jgi:hypothetical protein